MGDATANENHAARHNIAANNATGNAGKQASPQSIAKEGIAKKFYKIHTVVLC